MYREITKASEKDMILSLRRMVPAVTRTPSKKPMRNNGIISPFNSEKNVVLSELFLVVSVII